MIKKIIFVIITATMLMGCQSNVEDSNKDVYEGMAISSQLSDIAVYQKIQSTFLARGEEVKQKYKNTSISSFEEPIDYWNQVDAIAIVYLDDLYQLASTRVSLDLQILYSYDKEYISYVSTMQSFSEVYLQYQDAILQNPSVMRNWNAFTVNHELGRQVILMEQTMELVQDSLSK